MFAVNQLPIIDPLKSTTGCCTLIEPSDWDEQMFIFKDKLFAYAQTKSFLHVPLNMSSVMSKAQAKIDKAGARSNELLVLSYEDSPWHATQYFAVTKEVPGLETARFSGTFVTKVFEGSYKDVQNWYKLLNDYVKSLDKKAIKIFFFYTTCPKCSKAYGKNYVVGFAKVN
ncbi:MAG: hypothetical protein QG628_807 [Patescibacteria group bacterium]|jgi:hypothetical protein|nr:hypothetical protein [Patescibacteria group bacterium]